MDVERLAINQITTPTWSLAQAIEGYGRQGVRGVGVWRDKLAECGVRRARSLLRDADAWVPSLCKAGDLARLAARGEDPRSDCQRAIEEAAEIGAACVVFVCGGMSEADRSIDAARRRVADLLQEVAPFALQHGVALGIEPFHPMHAAERGCVNTLAQAHRLCKEVGDAARVVLDIFHVWWDPELHRFLASPFIDAMATVQLCDWRIPTRHPVNDRAMVGNGAGNAQGIVHALETNGYRGPYEIEIFSEEWWSMEPDVVVGQCLKYYKALAARQA